MKVLRKISRRWRRLDVSKTAGSFVTFFFYRPEATSKNYSRFGRSVLEIWDDLSHTLDLYMKAFLKKGRRQRVQDSLNHLFFLLLGRTSLPVVGRSGTSWIYPTPSQDASGKWRFLNGSLLRMSCHPGWRVDPGWWRLASLRPILFNSSGRPSDLLKKQIGVRARTGGFLWFLG